MFSELFLNHWDRGNLMPRTWEGLLGAESVCTMKMHSCFIASEQAVPKPMWLLAEGGGRWWEGGGPWLRLKDFASLSLWSRPQCIRPRWWWGGVGVLRGGLSALLKISASSQGLSFAHVCLTGVCLGSRLQRQDRLRPTAPRAPEAGKVSP